MAKFYICGDTVSLAAGASGSLSFRIPVAMKIKYLAAAGTGRFEVSEWEIVGGPKFIRGKVDSNILRPENGWTPVQPQEDVKENTEISIELKDLSGATNDIYCAVIGERAE